MKLTRILVLSAAAGLAAAVSWHYMRPQPVAWVTPRRGDAAQIVYATGTVEPVSWAKVTPLIRERIVELCDCEGRKVRRGDVLARLDSAQAQATLAELKAREQLAKAEHERLSVLLERNAASQQALDRARSEVHQSTALISGQTARLESHVLRAPMDGTILRKDGEVGEIAEPGTVLFWIGEARPLRIVADVNEEDIPQVKPGQETLVRADAFPERVLEAKVESITPKGDPVAKVYRVYLTLPGDTPVMIGMTVELNIVTRVVNNALLLPTKALQGDAVFVIEGGKALRRTLRIGIRGTSEAEILSGLAEDGRVVSPFPEKLTDGAHVAPEGG